MHDQHHITCGESHKIVDLFFYSHLTASHLSISGYIRKLWQLLFRTRKKQVFGIQQNMLTRFDCE
jgi:hypothetical protein